MDLAHLDRIAQLADAAMNGLPWLAANENDNIPQNLLDFDSHYWAFSHYLSRPLYQETTLLLKSGQAAHWLPERPRLAVVIPVHEAEQELLSLALDSLRLQVGVDLEIWISVDGRCEDQQLVRGVADQLANHAGSSAISKLEILHNSDNLGVGRCRNRALQHISSPWFTCLDADDIFHPLRCLHALLLLRQLGVQRLNTGWSRVSLRQGKIVLINGRMASHGHNSFMACTSLLSRYGYLADLRVHEDTEYQQRLQYFRVPMQTTAVVGHYLNTEVTPDYQSLSTPLRKEVHVIEGHPYLCGSVIAEADEERLRIHSTYQKRYGELCEAALQVAFPPD